MPTYQTKIILVGSSGIGKTSLIGAFIGNQFESVMTPTVAPGFCSRTVKLDGDTVIDLQCWDTAGQERYIAISKTYYRDANIALVCYAPSDFASLETWSGRVREVTETCKLFAVITKSDTLSAADLEEDESASSSVLKKLNALRFVTSARTGAGITQLVDAIATASIPEVAQATPLTSTRMVDLEGAGKRKKKCC
jgi:small GTP-binding protein